MEELARSRNVKGTSVWGLHYTSLHLLGFPTSWTMKILINQLRIGMRWLSGGVTTAACPVTPRVALRQPVLRL